MERAPQNAEKVRDRSQPLDVAYTDVKRLKNFTRAESEFYPGG